MNRNDFIRRVVDGLAEGERLQRELDTEVFIPYGRCRLHPSVSTVERGFEVGCYICESEMAEE